MTAEASSSETTFERLLSMDIIRGIAIIGVLFVHPLLFGVWRSAANAIAVVPNYVVFIFLPLIFLMSWGGGFTFISGIVNTYVFYKRLKQGVSFKKAAIPIFLNNTFLLLVTPLKLYFFERLIYSYYEPDKLITSVFVYLFREGQLHWPHHERMFRPLILPSIALAGYFSIFLFWVLFRNNGFLKIKRNIIILCVLAVILFATSNVIVDALSPYVELWYFKEG
ncbi:MAG: hypothetical protein U9O98_10500, partial [Asgard group archaeon]|nr:hypothetical protein [Asgard group archaeon]